MDRRSFLSASFAWGLGSRIVAAGEPEQEQGFVTSETGRLQRVIVHPPGAETRKTFPFLLGNHSMLTWELLRPEAARQHEAFVKLLEQSGAEVLLLENLLADAIAQARKQGVLADWLQESAPALGEHEEEITAAALLGRDDRFVYATSPSGLLQPAMRPPTTLFFTRDLAVMTPRGVVLCNFGNAVRSFEAKLARLVFAHAPALAKYPIVYDAAKDDVFVEGGDVMVLDESTLLVGVGNATDEKAAARLAQQTEMDVVAVQMPTSQWRAGEWDGLQTIFFHLDCLISCVARRHVLAVPYLLEKEQHQRNPLLDVLYGFARLNRADKASRVALLEEVRRVGWITRYEAVTGRRHDSPGEMKLLDYLRGRGYRVTYVGGPLPEADDRLRHAVENVVRECRFMGINVVATQPGRLVAYDGTPRTLAALRAAGIEAATFSSGELVRANGGPHCLTLPLEREP